MFKNFHHIKDCLEAISYICVVLGIGFATFEYLSSKQSEREKNSISYIQNFQSSDIAKSRFSLQRPWLQFPFKSINGKSGSSDVIDRIALNNIFPEDGSVNSDHLIRVVDYLDVLGTCIENEICDHLIGQKHFGDYVDSLWCLYQAPIKRLRQEYGLSSLGIGMLFLRKTKTDC